MNNLGKAAKYLRKRLGLTQAQAAGFLNISHIHVHNIECEKSSPTATILDKYHDAFGIDLYMLAVVKFSQERLPAVARPIADEMLAEWEHEIESRIKVLKDGRACKECRN